MQFDAFLASPALEDMGDYAAAAEEMGFDGAWVTEMTHSPFTLMTRAADHTTHIDIGTAIAVAFPRSPMITAYTAWDIQSLSGGRFILGLGTQVKGHIERRFSETWESPGPRLREYLLAVREIWDSWLEDRHPAYDGEFYQINLCPPDWRPDPIDDPTVPIYIAGVNEYNLRLAGELCDGLHVHPLHSPEYIDEVVLPNIRRGADRGGRDPDDVTLATTVFAVVGETDEAREKAREDVRRQIAFYGSTRTYRTIFAVHGWEDLCDDLHELSVNGQWSDMPALVTDEMVDAFSVEGSWSEIRDRVEARYEHIDRVGLYTSFRGESHWQEIAAPA